MFNYRKISCASCHRPEHAFADATALSPGVFGRRTKRNSPSILNAGYSKSFFWDGRVSTLEEQVIQPIINPLEMDLSLEKAVDRLNSQPDYRKAFEQAFGKTATPDNLARALAVYVRSLRSGDSPADRYAEGDSKALNDEARAGLKLFRGKANCVQCHFGPLFSDESFHNSGIGWGRGDAGRFAVTENKSDRGSFKTPSLRNVALTAPYMHDGSIATLEDVVEFYDRGGNPNKNLDPEIRPLQLSRAEKRQLIALLLALTSSSRPATP